LFFFFLRRSIRCSFLACALLCCFIRGVLGFWRRYLFGRFSLVIVFIFIVIIIIVFFVIFDGRDISIPVTVFVFGLFLCRFEDLGNRP
jgi:hypothetical protein